MVPGLLPAHTKQKSVASRVSLGTEQPKLDRSRSQADAPRTLAPHCPELLTLSADVWVVLRVLQTFSVNAFLNRSWFWR